MSLSPGSRLGHYHVTALIGEGGMGQVYQATDTHLDRQVAIKVLPDAFASDADRLARFEREAKVGAAPLQQDGSQIVLLNEYNAVREDRSLDDDGTDIFFDRVQGNGGNWFELVVVGDGTAGSTVDLRGWTIAIEDDGAPSAMTLSDHEYWRRVQAGTILTFIEKNDDHPRDTSTAILKEDRLATAGWAWTNVWTGDEAYVSDGGSSFSVSHDSTQFTLKDRTGHIVFGPAGEKGSFVGGGIGSREVYQLLDDPSPQVTPGSRHTDETKQ